MSAPLTVSAHEAAALLGQATSTIYDQVRSGQIPNVGVGAAVRIPRVWLEERFAAAGAPVDLTPAERVAEHTGVQS